MCICLQSKQNAFFTAKGNCPNKTDSSKIMKMWWIHSNLNTKRVLNNENCVFQVHEPFRSWWCSFRRKNKNIILHHNYRDQIMNHSRHRRDDRLELIIDFHRTNAWGLHRDQIMNHSRLHREDWLASTTDFHLTNACRILASWSRRSTDSPSPRHFITAPTRIVWRHQIKGFQQQTMNANANEDWKTRNFTFHFTF